MSYDPKKIEMLLRAITFIVVAVLYWGILFVFIKTLPPVKVVVVEVGK